MLYRAMLYEYAMQRPSTIHHYHLYYCLPTFPPPLQIQYDPSSTLLSLFFFTTTLRRQHHLPPIRRPQPHKLTPDTRIRLIILLPLPRQLHTTGLD
jgi:hypothetical protein